MHQLDLIVLKHKSHRATSLAAFLLIDMKRVQFYLLTVLRAIKEVMISHGILKVLEMTVNAGHFMRYNTGLIPCILHVLSSIPSLSIKDI